MNAYSDIIDYMSILSVAHIFITITTLSQEKQDNMKPRAYLFLGTDKIPRRIWNCSLASNRLRQHCSSSAHSSNFCPTSATHSNNPFSAPRPLSLNWFNVRHKNGHSTQINHGHPTTLRTRHGLLIPFLQLSRTMLGSLNHSCLDQGHHDGITTGRNSITKGRSYVLTSTPEDVQVHITSTRTSYIYVSPQITLAPNVLFTNNSDKTKIQNSPAYREHFLILNSFSKHLLLLI